MAEVRRILVVGLKEHQSGKTTLARAILTFLNRQGVTACGFKPRAGNSLWYDYDVVSESLREGRLYGSDAKLLRSASGGVLPEERHNPVHRLWSVPSHHQGTSSGLPSFLVDRVAEEGVPRVVAVRNAAEPLPSGTEALLTRFLDSCEVLEARTPAELAALAPMYDRAVEQAHRTLESRYETMVYESYADIALPWKGMRSLDTVLAVEPGRVYLYDGRRYLRACELTGSVRGEEVPIGTAVCRLLKEERIVELPPQPSGSILPTLVEKVPELLAGAGGG